MRLSFDISGLVRSKKNLAVRSGIFNHTNELGLALKDRTDVETHFTALDQHPKEITAYVSEEPFWSDSQVYVPWIVDRPYRPITELVASYVLPNDCVLRPAHCESLAEHLALDACVFTWRSVNRVPVNLPVPAVQIIYDLIPLKHPEWFDVKVLGNVHDHLRGLLGSFRQRDGLIVSSESVKNDVLRLNKRLREEQIRVVQLGVTQAELPGRSRHSSGLNSFMGRFDSDGEGGPPFLLVPGTIEPRKNPLLPLKVLEQLVGTEMENIRLIFAGSQGWLSEPFFDYLNGLPFSLRSKVEVLGYVSQERLHDLYRNCFAVLFPSFEEGFGMPIIEAQSAAKPVLTGTHPSVSEINPVSENAIDLGDFAAWAKRLLVLARDPVLYQMNSETCLRFSSNFTWSRSAQGLVDGIAEILGGW